jgi:hypothetical protein
MNSLLCGVLTLSVQPAWLLMRILTGHDRDWFFVDEMEIFFRKLRIPTLTFSKDTNWIIGEPTGAAAWLGIKRPTNNRTSRSDEMLVTLQRTGMLSSNHEFSTHSRRE